MNRKEDLNAVSRRDLPKLALRRSRRSGEPGHSTATAVLLRPNVEATAAFLDQVSSAFRHDELHDSIQPPTGVRTLANASARGGETTCAAVVQQPPESADQGEMSRRWAARSLLVVGFAAVIVTAGLSPGAKTAQAPSTPSQPAVAYCVSTGTKQVCVPTPSAIAVPGSTNSKTYCISVVSGGHWAHIVGPGAQFTNDPGATTDPCAGLSG